MKFYDCKKYFFIILILAACKPVSNEYFGEAISRDTYRITKQLIEHLDSLHSDTLEYEYEEKNDFFPVNIKFYNSLSDSIKKIIHFELDEWRMPRKQITMINDSIVETVELVYNHTNYYLLEKTIYDGLDLTINKSKHIRFEYDERDYLISIYEEYFSKDTSFINNDGSNIVSCKKTRILPSTINRQKGNEIPFSFVEYYVRYITADDISGTKGKYKRNGYSQEIGKVFEKYEAIFDSDGFPAYSSFLMSDSTKVEQWYQTDKDGFGQVIKLLSFNDSEYTLHSEQSRAISFHYDDRTIISNIESKLYNPRKNKFDRTEFSKSFKWLDHKLNNPQNFILMKLGYSEKVLNDDYKYTINERHIPIFANDVIVEEFFSYPEKMPIKKIKPYKRISYNLEKVKIPRRR